MKKRLFPILLAIVMSLSMLPVSAMAASSASVTVDEGTLLGTELVQGTPQSYTQSPVDGAQDYNYVNKSVGDEGVWARLPRLASRYIPSKYAIPKTGSVVVSQDGIIGDCSFTLEETTVSGYSGTYPAIAFKFNTLKPGRVTVKLTYYYYYGALGYYWVKENATFTVNVVEPQKPSKPGKSAIDSFWELSTGCAVRLDCDRVEDHYALYVRSNDGNNNLSYWGNYDLGEVVANPGNLGMGKDNYPWVCPMTIDASGFLEYYNYGYPGHEGYAKTEGVHMLADGQEDPTVYWFWDKKDNSWKFNPSDAPIKITITCPALPSEEDIIDELGENAVKVECETDSTKHPAKFYELTKDSLTIPELPSWSDSKGYYIDVAVAADDYVDDYETAYGTHTLKSESPRRLPSTMTRIPKNGAPVMMLPPPMSPLR